MRDSEQHMLSASRPRGRAGPTRASGQTTPSRTKPDQRKPRKTKEKALDFLDLFGFLFVRFRAFQWVTGDLRQKIIDPRIQVVTKSPEQGADLCAPVSPVSLSLRGHCGQSTTAHYHRLREDVRTKHESSRSPDVGAFPFSSRRQRQRESPRRSRIHAGATPCGSPPPARRLSLSVRGAASANRHPLCVV